MSSQVGHLIPRIASPSTAQFSFTTVPGYEYATKRIRSLAGSNQWSGLAFTNGTGNAVTVLDPMSDAPGIYSVMRQPAP